MPTARCPQERWSEQEGTGVGSRGHPGAGCPRGPPARCATSCHRCPPASSFPPAQLCLVLQARTADQTLPVWTLAARLIRHSSLTWMLTAPYSSHSVGQPTPPAPSRLCCGMDSFSERILAVGRCLQQCGEFVVQGLCLPHIDESATFSSPPQGGTQRGAAR